MIVDRGEIQVLHVDDEPAFLDLVKTFLEREHEAISVVQAEGAAAGLDELERRSIDCVVSDFQMDGPDGLELLEAVRDRDPSLPFILFTGRGSESVASEAIAAGVTDYLQKGMGSGQYEMLANRIDNAVDRRRTERALAESQRRLSTLIEALPGFVYRCGNEPGRPMEFVSDGAAAVTGYDSGTLETGAVDFTECIHEADRDEIRARVDDAIDNDEPFEVTYRLNTKNGETRWLWEQGRGVRSDGGEVDTLEGLVTNVSDDDRLHRELRDLTAKIRTLHGGVSRLEDAFDGEPPADEDECCSIAADVASDLLEADGCVVAALAGGRDGDASVDDARLVPKATDGGSLEAAVSSPSLEGPIVRCLERGETVRIDDIAETTLQAGVRSSIVIPIGEYGVLQVVSTTIEGFDRTDRELGELLAAYVSQVLP